MMYQKLMQALLELLSLLLLLTEQLLIPLIVSLLLVGIVLLSASQLDLVSLPHLPQLLIVHAFHFSLSVL